MGNGVWKGVYPSTFGHSHQLSLNKFFNQRSGSMRKGCDGEVEEEEKKSENSGSLTSLPVDHLNGDRLQRRRSC